jgi:hypothetical protein
MAKYLMNTTNSFETKPDAATVKRMMFYIDGSNLYYGLMSKGWGRFRWLDLHALDSRFAQDGHEVAGVKYFTARVTAPPDAAERQAVYLQALDRHQGVDIIEGSMEQRELVCPHC